MDILPTVARLAGTTEPRDRIIDGRDALDLWLGRPGARSPHDAYFYYANEELHAVRGGDWKLHVRRPDWKREGFRREDYYLFNLRRDPGEKENLAAAYPEEVKRLLKLIERGRRDLGDDAVGLAGENVRPAGVGEPPISYLPPAIAKMKAGSRNRAALEKALQEAPRLAYKMRDWQWAEVGGEKLTLDAWWPHGAGPWPMLVWVHGGGWRGGFKELGNYTARRIAEKGYVVLSINYRLAPQHSFPAAVEDCLGAVVWAKREAARFNGDPARVAIGGESAGGNLAAMVAYAADSGKFVATGARAGDPSPKVQAVIPVYGAFDLAALAEADDSRAVQRRQLFDQYLPGGIRDYAAASPISYLDANDPPTLLICGDKDQLFEQSVAFDKALGVKGVAHEFEIPRGSEHAFIVWEWDSKNSQLAYQKMISFLDQWLKIGR